MATGQPKASPKRTTSAASVSATVVPGTTTTPAFSAAMRADSLSPIISMASGGGPMNTAPASATARAKAASSARNP